LLILYLGIQFRPICGTVQRITPWGFDYEGEDRTVDVHIKRLRERFAEITDDFQISTVYGLGYRLAASTAAEDRIVCLFPTKWSSECLFKEHDIGHL
jgi:hypothetical protein